MMERKTGGWLSSVVGNISGLWSRSAIESSATFRGDTDTHHSSRNSSYEEQAESDVGEEDDGIIVESICAGPSATEPTTSCSRSDSTPKRRAVRYLSPSALLAATRSVTTSSDNETLKNVTRKRAATSCLFQDDIIWSNAGNAFATPSVIEPPSGRFSTKRSRIQRDFADSILSLSSSSDAPPTGKSHSNQSFASSFTPLNSLVTKPRVSRPSCSSSSLSSKTRAILEQLEKISSPVKEVKRFSSLNLDGPERWASDSISSAVQKPPRNSMCSLSRAQLISNILATKSSSSFWSRPACSAKAADSFTASDTVQNAEYTKAGMDHKRESDKVPTTKSSNLPLSKKIDFPSSSKKPDGEKFLTDDNADKTVSAKAATLPMSASVTETTDIILPQHPISAKSTNVFSARDLGVVSPVKEMVRNDEDKLSSPTKVDGAMFAFAPPIKRGPSSNFHREEKTAKTPQSISSSASKTTAERPVGGFSLSNEDDSKQMEEQSNTAEKGKEAQPVIEVSKVVKSTDTSVAKSDTSSVKETSQKSSEQWSCPKCMVFNKADVGKCICCGYENHLHEAKPWTCSECWVSNKSTIDKCIACGNPKQSNGKSAKLTNSTQSSSYSNVFGDRTFKPVPSSGGISFGFASVKPVTDGANSTPVTSAPLTKAQNSDAVLNGNANTEFPLKFGLSSSSLAPSFGFGKIPVANSLPTVTEEQPLAFSSSHPPITSSAFGVSSGSSVTSTSFIPSLTRSSLSFPTLTVTTAAVTTLPAPGSTVSVPISTNVNPFTFGSSNTTAVEKTRNATLFTFGSTFPAVTTNAATVTNAASLPSFGTALPGSSAPKAPLFGTSSGVTVGPEGSHDVVEMSSPTTSPVAPAVGTFEMSKSSTTSLFNFGAVSSSTSTGTSFDNSQTAMQNPLAAPSTSLFSFGQQQTLAAPKPFEPAASLTSPPSTFNFGGIASNGAHGFAFGSTSPPSNFTFGAQQPVNNAASATFNFTAATPAPSLGNISGSVIGPNPFSVGSTSSTNTRRIIKARRTRK